MTSARMLRYRERLGLLPPGGDATQHRRYDEHALATAAYAMELERTYDVSPSTLAFALRAVTDPSVAASLRRLARQVGLETTDARSERLRLTPGA
jgi:MerR family copper efflux transcriptional regulator